MVSPEHYMRMALACGRLALPSCLPNPPVGCVAVSDGIVLAHGYTQPPGLPHAEVMALAAIPAKQSNITIYTTLEPCSFYGRTPSCAYALVERGVQQVFVAVLDPDPRNSGAGVAILRDAGIKVHLGLLANEALFDLHPFLIGSR